MDLNQQGNQQYNYAAGYYPTEQNHGTTAYPQNRQGMMQGTSFDGMFENPNSQNQKRATMGMSRSLTREERMEAKRLMEEAAFTFEGYQVVRREFMSHQFDPAMTIRGNSITFNNACISKLEDATYIHFLINPTQMKLVIQACEEGERDAVRWCITKDDKRKSRQITCGIFTAKLYEMMGWDGQYRYKLQGMRITYQGKPLYLFDLNASEAFLPQTKDPETGKVKRAKPVLPMEWRDSFGMTVSEHAASTKVNLSEGYEETEQNAATENAENVSDDSIGNANQRTLLNFEEAE